MKTATAAAARMGTRAGQAFRSYGTPSRCPFPAGSALGKAWAHAYLAALRP